MDLRLWYTGQFTPNNFFLCHTVKHKVGCKNFMSLYVMCVEKSRLLLELWLFCSDRPEILECMKKCSVFFLM